MTNNSSWIASGPDGAALIGGWLSTPSRPAARAYLAAGFDYVGIDWQHGLTSRQQAFEIVRDLEPSGRVMIRVSANEPAELGRALDVGADAVIVPLVESAAEAERAVGASLFPPRGVRSFGPLASKLGGLTPAQLDERAHVIVMIETLAGLENVEEIAAVQGLGGMYIGPADLSIDHQLDPFSAFSSDQIQEQFARVAAAAQANNVPLGAHAIDGASAKRWISWGADFVSLGTEDALLKTGATTLLSSIKGEAAPRGDGSRWLY